MASSKEGQARQQLINILKAANVHEEIQAYLLDQVKAASLVDFVGLVKVETCEDDLVETLVAQTWKRDALLEHSRVRAAWRAARLVCTWTEERRASGVADELDEPLDEATHTELNANFQANHHFTLCMHLTPSDILNLSSVQGESAVASYSHLNSQGPVVGCTFGASPEGGAQSHSCSQS